MRKFRIFGKNLSQGTNPPEQFFYKIKGGGGCSSSGPSRQISPLSLLKCGPTAPKIAKVGNFWYKFAQKGIPLYAIFTKNWFGEGFPGLHPHA